MTFKITITHEFSFPTDGLYTGLLMSWFEKQEIGYTFSKGEYVVKLTDSEWVNLLGYITSVDFKGEEEIDIA